MHIGLVGLGKMGGNMRTRMRERGVTVVGYDRNPELADVDSLAALVEALPDSPKVVWVMVPAGDPTRDTIRELGDLLGKGDLVVDGGNSKWTDDQLNAEMLGEKGIGFVDCGVSGGVWGLENGYALMCGGSDDDVAKVQPAFDALRPEGDSGFVHAGQKPGAGHFAKMVHNGIEYAIMQSYAEGFELLEKTDLVENVVDVFDSWRQGTVIRSWLLDLLVEALRDDTHLDQLRGYADDSGEGRWTVQAAIDHAVPMNVIAASLFARFTSRQDDSPAMKAIAAMRNQFGGHAVHTAPPVRRRRQPGLELNQQSRQREDQPGADHRPEPRPADQLVEVGRASAAYARDHDGRDQGDEQGDEHHAERVGHERVAPLPVGEMYPGPAEPAARARKAGQQPERADHRPVVDPVR